MLLKDQAYEEIKDRILDGRIPPGAFLAERVLASELGMSKTPVRAAIGRLELEGFVAVAPQQGIVVREISLDEVVDLFDIRIAIESFVVKRLAGRLSSAQLERIEENIVAQREAVQAADVDLYMELDARFHRLFGEFLGNTEILRLIDRQQDKLHRVLEKILKKEPGRLKTSTDEHWDIAGALLDGDGERAAASIEAHLTYGKRALIER